MESDQDPIQPETESGRGSARLRSSWPLWVLGLGGVLLTSGLAAGVLVRPKPDIGAHVTRAERLVERGSYREAIDRLNAEAMPHVSKPWVSEADRGRYHRTVARAVYGGQRELGIHHPGNDESIRRGFVAAENAGVSLTPDDVVALCDTYVALGLEDLAVERVARLGPDASSQRRLITRRLVEHEIQKDSPDYDRAISLLSSIVSDTSTSADDRAWSLARETEIRLGQGHAGEAASRLMQGLVRLPDASAGITAELYVLLGSAYMDLGDYPSAQKQLERAVALLGNTEPMRARAECLLAICDQSDGEFERARDRFERVSTWAVELPWRLPALLGLAETEGVLANSERALQAYSELVRALDAGEEHPLVDPMRVAGSLLGLAEDHLVAGDPESALRFLVQAEELHGTNAAPPDLLMALAQSHEQFARSTLGLVDGGDERVAELVSRLDDVSRAIVQRHYIASARYFVRHANAVVLSDNEAYVGSLWRSALNYDRGGDYERTIAQLREYIEGVPDDQSSARTSTQAEAKFRLAHAYQARGDHALAADTFRGLIDGTEPGGVGQYAQASYVPLARSLLSDGVEENDGEAEELLLQAVNGAAGGVGSQYFHDALLGLGELLHRRAEWPRAIGRLREALARYPEDPHAPLIRYRLADSLRREAAEILETLQTEAMPDPQYIALENKREEHLRDALSLFAAVLEELSEDESPTQSEERRVALRNTHFFLGDCAFDLGDYDAAVRHYETAREVYAEDPASLVAMVQIVNSYVALGEMDRARAADERAKRFFASLPEDAWADPFLPMSRADWERWLDSTSELYGFGGG